MILKTNRCIPLLLIFNFFLTGNISGQKIECNAITVDMNFTVGSVKIIGRWVPKDLQSKVEQFIGVGEIFDPAKVGMAEELVRNEIIASESEFAIRLVGSTSVLFITSDVCPVVNEESKMIVQVVIHPYYLRIDLYNLGNNILPIPRTAKPSFYKQVPSLLLATAPYIGILNDRRFGTSAFIKTATDLLHLAGIKDSPGRAKRLRLDLDVNLQKSVTDPFHNTSGLLQLVNPVYTDSTMGWNFGVMYSNSSQPLDVNIYHKNLVRIFGSLSANGKISFLNKYMLGGGIQFSQNNSNALNNKIQDAETRYEFNALSDGRVANGLTRIGLWFNIGVPGKRINKKTYERIAGKFGYAVSLGRGHNNVDLETVLSSGYTWGAPPVYSEFFAGNTASHFLYEPLQSISNSFLPEGPVIRSLGEKEGGLTSSLNTVSGGTSYWGLNLNFSIPISKWAKPLLPDVVIQDEPRRITIRSAVKGQVITAKSFIANDLALNGGLTDDEADAAAEQIVNKDIKPTINYLADRANIYSIKPEIFFDLGQVSKRNADKEIWAAAGAGLQINIVNARLEFGYVQTILPKSDASKGNFLVRFSVQNFF